MYWIQPLPKARQAKATQAKDTDDLQWVWLVFGWTYCQQPWWPCSGLNLGWSCPPCLSLPTNAMVVQNSFWRVFGCKGGWLHFPLQIESPKPFRGQEKLSRGAKGLLHIILNFLACKIPESLNFLTSIRIYIPQNIYAAKQSSPSFSYTRNSYTVFGLYIIWYIPKILCDITMSKIFRHE